MYRNNFEGNSHMNDNTTHKIGNFVLTECRRLGNYVESLTSDILYYSISDVNALNVYFEMYTNWSI